MVQQEKSFKDISNLISSGGPLVQRSKIICSILVEGIMRNNSEKLFCIWTSGSGGDAI